MLTLTLVGDPENIKNKNPNQASTDLWHLPLENENLQVHMYNSPKGRLIEDCMGDMLYNNTTTRNKYNSIYKYILSMNRKRLTWTKR